MMAPANGLIDVHSHHLPDWYVEMARAAGHERPDGMPAWPQWDPKAHLEFMRRNGIGRSLLSLSSPGVTIVKDAQAVSLARDVNEYSAGIVERHPQELGFLASLPQPDTSACVTEARHAMDTLGADGVILQTHAAGAYVSDRLYEPLWEELASRKCVVLLHPTSPAEAQATSLGHPSPLMEFLFDTTRVIVTMMLDGTLDRHPDLRLLVPHSGSLVPMLVDRAAQFQALAALAEPQTTRPVTESIRDLWWDTAGTPSKTHLQALLRWTSPERLVYGSDHCFTPEIGVQIQQSVLDNEADGAGLNDWRALVTRNTQELFSGSAGAAGWGRLSD